MTEWLPSVTWDDVACAADETAAPPAQQVSKTVAKKRASRARAIEKLAEDVICFQSPISDSVRQTDEGQLARQADDSSPVPRQPDDVAKEVRPAKKESIRPRSSDDLQESEATTDLSAGAVKRHKTAHNTEAQPGQAGSQQHKKGQQPETTLSKMKSRLQGGRFRMLNERLYTSQGQDAFSLMQESPGLFKAYHEGFRVQAQTWKSNPVDLAIKWLRKKSKGCTVADFGCGDARIAETLHNTHTVHSFDLYAHNKWVTACNMAEVPCENGTCDVVIFSLALMGTDYPKFLQEAQRILKAKGFLWIAEVRSRFVKPNASSEDFSPFLACLNKLGFDVVKHDSKNQMFVIWILQKVRLESNTDINAWPELTPCIYKRR